MEIKTITWRDVSGNKLSRQLHPGMLTEKKYYKYARIREIGAKDQVLHNIEYDSDYAITWLSRKVCRPLQVLGKKQVLELIEKAWELNKLEELSRPSRLIDVD